MEQQGDRSRMLGKEVGNDPTSLIPWNYPSIPEFV